MRVHDFERQTNDAEAEVRGYEEGRAASKNTEDERQMTKNGMMDL